MLTKKRSAQFLLIAFCFLLFPVLAHAGLESSLLGIKTKLKSASRSVDPTSIDAHCESMS